MRTVKALTKRNIKIFFKDKPTFFTSLATPMILLVLYATFLAKGYREIFMSSIPEGACVSSSVIDGLVGGQLLSSLLSVSCVTVAFCSNLIMVSDRAKGTVRDFLASPVKSYQLSVSYFLATLASTLTVAFCAMAIGLVYLGFVGFYMSLADVLLLALDVVVLVLFGTALSSVVTHFLSKEGQMSAVGSIVSSVYGFVSGAYMPISTYGEGLSTALGFFPGTYGTVLMRGHAMRGTFEKLEECMPPVAVDELRLGVDAKFSLLGSPVPEWAMYLVLFGSVALLVSLYVFMNIRKRDALTGKSR